MLPSPAAAHLSLDQSAYRPQVGANAMQRSVYEPSVSKENTFSVPTLHTSFQTFENVLASALRQPDFSRFSDMSTDQSIKPGEENVNTDRSSASRVTPRPTTALAATSSQDASTEMMTGLTRPEEALEIQAHSPADDNASTTVRGIDRVYSSNAKLGGKNQLPVASPPAMDSEPKSGDASASFIAVPALAPKEFGPDTTNAVQTDPPATGHVTGVGFSRISAHDGELKSQPGLTMSDTEGEAFCIRLQTGNDGVSGSGSISPSEDPPGSQEPPSLARITGNLNEQQSRDLPSQTVPESNASRDETGLSKTGPLSEGAAGKNALSKQQEQAPVTRQTTATSNHDQESQASAGDHNRDPEVLTPNNGWQVAEARAVEAKGEQSTSARPAQLPEPVETTRSNVANEMTLRVEGGSGQVISVHLLNQGGQVQLAVRSSDPSTAYQLRQDLTTLTGNLDRIGWKSDIIGTAMHGASVVHTSSGSGRNSQPDESNPGPEWHEQPSKKKPHTPELWDELVARQTT